MTVKEVPYPVTPGMFRASLSFFKVSQLKFQALCLRNLGISLIGDIQGNSGWWEEKDLRLTGR